MLTGKKTQVKLSVIVANYNNAKFIVACIESVLSQTYDNFEIVISDDCSTDTSQTIIKKLTLKYPQVRSILNSQNMGVAANRHQAILKARGTYITTLDSDDFFYDERKLEREMRLMEYYEKKSMSVITFSKTVLVNEYGLPLAANGIPKIIKEGNVLKYLISRSCEIPRDFVMSKCQYDAVGGFDCSIPIYEDWDLKIRLASKFKFYYTGGIGTAYRQHPHGLSSVKLSKNIELLEKVFWKNFHLVGSNEKIKVFLKFQLMIMKRLMTYTIKGKLPIVNRLRGGNLTCDDGSD